MDILTNQWLGIRKCLSEDTASGESLVLALWGSIKYIAIFILKYSIQHEMLQHYYLKVVRLQSSDQQNGTLWRVSPRINRNPSHFLHLMSPCSSPNLAEHIGRINAFFTVLCRIRSRLSLRFKGTMTPRGSGDLQAQDTCHCPIL